MRRIVLVVCGGVVLLGIWALRAQAGAKQNGVERGAYLVAIGSCNDCHTPWTLTDKGPAPDFSRLLSGHPEAMKLPPPPAMAPGPWGFIGSLSMTAWAGPWGVSYAANLTPDQETGIGAWSEDTFIRAMRTGKHMGGGRDILPPMPWDWVGKMTDEDLKAVFAYLKSIKPIRNRVPDPLPPAPPAPPAKSAS